MKEFRLFGDNIKRLVEERDNIVLFLIFFTCLFLVMGVYFLVMATGGIRYVFSHSMYVPIVIAGLVFGVKGGVFIALIGGLTLGPLVPIDTSTMEPQLTLNWIYRLGYFVLIGSVIGVVSDWIRAYIVELSFLANYDGGTKLPNRRSLEKDIESLREANSVGLAKYLLVVNLENSKEIEGTYDLSFIDSIFKQVVYRVESTTSVGIKSYRSREDQLSILLTSDDVKNDIFQLCNSFRKYFQEPFVLDDLHIHCDLQIGVLKFDSIIYPAHVYVQQANVACVKATGKNAAFLIHDFQHYKNDGLENVQLLGRVKEALDNSNLSMHFQPKANLVTGAVDRVESLMRWHHPTLGNIPPGKFIPRAERSTLIDRLTEFAIDHSLEKASVLRRNGINIKVAVNVSVRNIFQPRFSYQVMSLLDKHEMDGSSLELELTESSLMQNVEDAILILKSLSRLGVVISIDDYGTGYSSLQYLQRLPVSILKIDQSFIQKLSSDSESLHIVDNTISLAHRMSMKVVAEGVEDIESLRILKNMGCDMAQGYHIARPCSPEEFGSWYRQCGGVYQF